MKLKFVRTVKIKSTITFNNTVLYSIFKEDAIIATVNIENSLSCSITYNSLQYYIRPNMFLFTTSGHTIYDSSDVKIGYSKFTGWTWRKPYLFVGDEKYIMRNIKKNGDDFQCALKNEKTCLEYFFDVNPCEPNYFLDERSEGFISFNSDELLPIIGIHLVELFFFTENFN